VRVHPEFRVIFTSNPVEYVGTHQTQNALLDRMITIHIPGFDQDTEIAIASAHSGLALEDASTVVHMLMLAYEEGLVAQLPSIRAAIMICRVLATSEKRPDPEDRFFMQMVFDVLKLYEPEQQAAFTKVATATKPSTKSKSRRTAKTDDAKTDE